MPGPAPKDPSTRARRNADPIKKTELRFVKGKQPKLPDRFDEEGIPRSWPAQTVAWWKMWRESSLADQLTDTDWLFLLDTALIHAAFWDGDLKQAAELRQRVAKYGATPEDRARLRISYATADEADDKAKNTRQAVVPPAAGSDPRRVLRAVR